MEEKKEKRVLTIELDDDVKKLSITGLGDDETVVMKQELSEEELDQATGGGGISQPKTFLFEAYGRLVCDSISEMDKSYLGKGRTRNDGSWY